MESLVAICVVIGLIAWFTQKVERAGIHLNPTPGPADQAYLYGHIWVTLSLVAPHPL